MNPGPFEHPWTLNLCKVDSLYNWIPCIILYYACFQSPTTTSGTKPWRYCEKLFSILQKVHLESTAAPGRKKYLQVQRLPVRKPWRYCEKLFSILLKLLLESTARPGGQIDLQVQRLPVRKPWSFFRSSFKWTGERKSSRIQKRDLLSCGMNQPRTWPYNMSFHPIL
jgi:hypothetical protein